MLSYLHSNQLFDMKIKTEYIFLVVALVWGFLQVFLIPPFQVPDEHAHFYRSWGLADFQLTCDKESEVKIPANAVALAQKLHIHRIGDGLFSFSEMKNLKKEEISSEKQEIFTQFCSYNPIGYLPQAGGILSAKILNLSPIQAFHLGRIFNLLAAILLIFYAIRIAPFGKTIFLLTALLPMTVHQLASHSGDALLIAGLMLFTSIVLYYSQKEKLKRNDLIYLITSSLLLIQIKPGYITFLLLLLILKPSQFAGKLKGYFSFLIITVVLNALLFLGLAQFADTDRYLKPTEWKTDPSAQASYILDHPVKYAGVMSTELMDNSWIYIRGMIGLFGWHTIDFPDLFHIFILFSIFVIIMASREKVNLNYRQRLVLFLTFWSVILSIFTIEYLFWSEIGEGSIKGIQGRYFIAAFPLIIFSIYRINLKNSKVRTAFVSIFILLISTISLYTTYRHYYSQEKHLAVEPYDKETISNPDSVIEEMNSLKEKEGRYTMESKKSTIILNTSNISGLSFSCTSQVEVKFSYLFENDSEFSKTDIAETEFPVVNIGLLEEKYGKKAKKLKIEIISKKKGVEIFDFKVFNR